MTTQIKSVCHTIEHNKVAGIIHKLEAVSFDELIKLTGKTGDEVLSALLKSYRAHKTSKLLDKAVEQGKEKGDGKRGMLDDKGKKIMEKNSKGKSVQKQESFSYEYPVLFNSKQSLAEVILDDLTPSESGKSAKEKLAAQAEEIAALKAMIEAMNGKK